MEVGGHDGLTVTITPQESAFFAGEVFVASVTFKNCAPVARLPSVHNLHSLSHAQQHAQQQRTTTWGQSKQSRKRPPSASQFGLADYTSHNLATDDVPRSPYFRSRDSATFSALPPTSDLDEERAVHSHLRSASTTARSSPVASTSKLLPVRKGLIGKPATEQTLHDRKNSLYGLYPGGPRRPALGGPAAAHGRAHSVASYASNSTPDLLHSRDRDVSRASSYTTPSIRVTSEQYRPSVAHSRDPSYQMPTIDSGHDAQRSRYPSAQSEALSSTFSLDSEDPYNPADSVSSLHRFYGTGQNDTMESVVRDNVDHWAKNDQRTPRALATRSVSSPAIRGAHVRQASYNASIASDIRTDGASFMSPPGTINLLWSFAHLEGFFEVDTELVKPAEFVDVKRSLIGAYGTGVGGGTLQKKKTSSGWRDWLWGAESAEEDAHAAASLEERRTLTMKDKSVPVWSNPPSILGVDVVLEPGESKTCMSSSVIARAARLTRSLKFTYQLVVGINRAQLGLKASADGSAASISRTMRVPIRLYNNVAVTGARPFYDLTNPVIAQRDDAMVVDADAHNPDKVSRPVRPDTGHADFEKFASGLLDSVALSSPEAFNNLTLSPEPRPSTLHRLSSTMSPKARPEMRTRTSTKLSLTADETDEPEDCRSAVEIVSRNSQKASFDINKDGFMVARLTLVKTAYRLGETVNGSILLNSGEGRVIRVSIRLETHEQIETSISTKSAPQVRATTARLHSEHHEMTLDSARIGFALAIPSGATPDFATSGVKLQWSVRLSFLVIPPSPAQDPPPRSAPSGGSWSGLRSPPSADPSSRTHGRSKSFAHGFQPAISLTLPDTPLSVPNGAAHLMPVQSQSQPQSQSKSATLDDRRRSITPNASAVATGAAAAHVDPHTAYRAVPDLGFVPVLFASAMPEPPPAPGPLQRSAHGHKRDMSLGAMPAQRPPSSAPANVVLVPAKVDTVECSIPIKVYPGNTAFRPTVTIFDC